MTVPPVPSGARTVSVPAERVSRWLDNFADRHGALDTAAAEWGAWIRGADGDQAWIELPFPPWEIPASRVLTSLSVEAGRDRVVAVLLVRRGGYAAGVFEGALLRTSKVGSAYVQGTTKAGGWSQQRYARRRDNQARAAFAEAAEVAVRILLPELSTLEALVLGGDRQACEAVLTDDRLRRLAELPRGPFLPVPDPKLAVLRASPAQFRAVTVRLLP